MYLTRNPRRVHATSALADGPVGADPSSNYKAGSLPTSCYSAPHGATCINAGVYYLDQARAHLHQGPYKLPADFPKLSPDEQVLQTLDCYNPEYKTDEDGRVTDLRLVGQHLPVAAFREINKLTELQIMDLAWSTTTDEDLAQLKDLRKLRHLGLGGTPVTDRGLAYLEKLPGLERLWVAKGTISAAGVEKLREARPDLQIYGFE